MALVYLGELCRVDPLQGLHFIVLVLSIHALARGLRHDVWVRQRQVVWDVQSTKSADHLHGVVSYCHILASHNVISWVQEQGILARVAPYH